MPTKNLKNMKKTLFVFTAVLSICSAQICSAQTAATPSQNEEYAKKIDAVRGHFDYKLNEREAVNVNYSLSPKHPTDIAHFSIHTPSPMPFSATVTNAAGKVVYTWKPETQVYLYNADWNLSKLGAGEYNVNVYMDGQKSSIYQFKFSKQ
jgi:outer membrane lipoprotein-sorting protein